MGRYLSSAVVAAVLCFGAAPADGSTGAFERTWGGAVDVSGASLCTVAANCRGATVGGRGTEFDTPSGLATDAAGNLYVVDSDQQRVAKFDALGNFIVMWGKDVGPSGSGFCTVAADCKSGQMGGLGGEFTTPTDVAIGSNGDVYVSDGGAARVQEFDPSGNFQRAWGRDVLQSGGNSCTVAANCKTGTASTLDGEFQHPSGIAADASANIYVSDDGPNGQRIQKFNLTGFFQRMWGKDVGGAGIDSCLISCVGGNQGSLGGQFSGPSDVAADAAGHVYVADDNNQRIQQFDSSGTFVRAWGKDVQGPGNDVCTTAASCTTGGVGPKGGQFHDPHRVAADSQDGVYVSDRDGDRIQRFDSSGGFLRAWGRDVDPQRPGAFGICTVAANCQTGTVGVLGGELSAPHGVATGPGGAVYVGDLPAARVQRFVLAAPALTGVSPVSPANQNVATINGLVEPGTTAKLFDNASCSGSSLGSGGAATLSSTGIDVVVPDDSTTTFFANTTDELGQVSPCSTTSLTYVEDSTAPDTLLDSPPSGTISTVRPTIAFHATEPNATFMCRFDAQAFAPCSGPGGSHTPLFPLGDGAHTFDVVATDQAGNADPTPAHASFAVSTALPPPVRGRLVNAIPETGTVLVKLPGGASKAHAAGSRFVPLETIGRQVPIGTTFDTSKGRVLLTAARNTSGSATQDGHFNGGLFVLGQGRKNPLTTLSMTGGGLRSCGKAPRGGSPKAHVARAKRRTLFSDVQGRFRTRGRHSVATVRGTAWRMTDKCKGTLTVVRRGSVVVRDLVKHRTVTLTAGQRYLARLSKH